MTTLERAHDIAATLVDTSKRCLLRDGHLVPVVFFVDGGKVTGTCAVDIPAVRAGKEHAYAAVAEFAKTRMPDLVIAVNDAFTTIPEPARIPKDWSLDPDTTEAIVVAIKGKSVGSHSFLVPYRKTEGGDIVFGEATPLVESQIHLIPDWWTLPWKCDFCAIEQTMAALEHIEAPRIRAFAPGTQAVPIDTAGRDLLACSRCAGRIHAGDLRGLVDRTVALRRHAYPSTLEQHEIEMLLLKIYAPIFSYLDHKTIWQRAMRN